VRGLQWVAPPFILEGYPLEDFGWTEGWSHDSRGMNSFARPEVNTMKTYEFTVLVNGRKTIIKETANSVGEAKKLIESRYAGQSVRFQSNKIVS
jgi:hypothetical protein